MKPAALVTGARRGIGRASCVALAQKGFDIVGADISAEGAEDTRAAVEAAGGRFAFIPADVGDTAAHAALIDAAWGTYGGLECLANIAGVQVQTRQDMLETTPDSWDRLLDVNTRGVFFLSQVMAKRMIADGAPVRGHRSLVFISSVNSVMASLNRAEYCVSKAGVTMVATLASGAIPYSTGHSFPVDGGMLMPRF